MILKYQLGFEDILALQKNFITVTKYHRRKEKLAFMVLLLFSFLLFFNLLYDILINFLSPNLLIVVSTVGAILITTFLSPYIRTIYTKVTIWQYKKAFKRSKHLDWPKNLTTVLNDKGIEVNVDNSKVVGKTSFSWEAFKKVSQDDERFYLYHSSTEALIIPKRRASKTIEEQKSLSDILHLNLKHLFD